MNTFIKKHSVGLLLRLLPKAILIRYLVRREGINLQECDVRSRQ
jgi:hypothetical protein